MAFSGLFIPMRADSRKRGGRFVSVSIKMGIGTSLALAGIGAALYFGLVEIAEEQLVSGKEQGARMANELFLRSATTPVLFDDETGIRDTVAHLAQDPDVLSVQLWRRKDGGTLAVHLAAGAQAVDSERCDTKKILRLENRILVRDVIRDPDAKVLADVAVQYSLSRELSALATLRMRLFFYTVVGIGVLALLLWAMARHLIIGPLSLLLDGVRRLESGQGLLPKQDGRNPFAGNDEVSVVADAFADMAAVVAAREHALLVRNRDMKLIMDNIAQGILSVRQDGALLPEHSAIVESWLGAWPRPNLDKETLAGYIERSAPKAAQWLEVLWQNVSLGALPLDVCLAQLPERIILGGRVLAVSYKPILGTSDEDQRILVVMSDVTAEVERQEAERGQRELIQIFQWAVKDRPGIQEYFVDAERLVERILKDDGKDPIALARDVHTLKGNSGVFGMGQLVEVCQTIENHFEEGGKVISLADQDALRVCFQVMTERRRQILGDERTRTFEIHEGELQHLIELALRATPSDEMVAALRLLTKEPAAQRLSRIGEQARQLALRLGKGQITVAIETNNVRLPEDELREFWLSFSHLVRNAVDHGLETPAERIAQGKSARGSLQLRAAVVADRLLLEIEDDGRGINWGALRDRAKEKGLPHDTREDLVEALFADGISTRDVATEVSGRGVGMAAVRKACEDSGGRIRVHSDPGAGTRFQFSWPAALMQKRKSVPQERP